MYLVRTDSLGDTVWTHTYPRDSAVQINNIIPLADGRIIVGAVYFISKTSGAPYYASYVYNAPWYMILDSVGNILSDTLYTIGFYDGAHIYTDVNGGYVITGSIDTLLTSDPTDIQNFPCYIAHLDSNFRITWLTQFPYSDDSGHRQPWLVVQLQDSGYVVLGDKWTNGSPGNFGWAAKINRNGEMVWSNSYQSDTLNDSHFRGAIENPDGSLVFVGEGYNDTLPSWHTVEDVWLVGTDSNGCQNAFCAPTAVKPIIRPISGFTLYPNPTTGNFTTNAPEAGVIEVYNIQGQQVATYIITQTETTLQLPGGIAAGMYFVKYISGGGNNAPVMVRLIKE